MICYVVSEPVMIDRWIQDGMSVVDGYFRPAERDLNVIILN